jgi:excinuclease ABC subunit C
MQIKTLPEMAGVYQYFNDKDEIIYVGKAKNLKKRVSSYFNNTQLSPKTYVLVRNIAYLKYIVVDSETDALLLENNLIKKHKPRYNVMLKDDKTYPSICISNEEFPRVFKTRKIEKNGAEYFGPYSSVVALNYLLNTIYEIFSIRTCRLPLTKEKIAQHKFNICLKYHIHKCNGICEAKEKFDDYAKNIEHVRKIIQGDADEISKNLMKEILALSEKQEFEKAYALKQKYDLLEKFKSRTIIANSVAESTDIFGYDEDEKSAYISVLRVAKGAIVQGLSVEYKKQIDEQKEDIFSLAILELREKLSSNSKEIVVPFEVVFPLENVKQTIPLRGDRKKLLELAEQNVKQFKLDKRRQAEKLNPDQRGIQMLKEIQDALQLTKLPMKIDIFDNSHIQGTNAVAACVVYKKGKPSKVDYRKFIIKTEETGGDDYASMREVVRRRYCRILEENGEMPDLIVADGGVGQMHAIRDITEGELNLQIPILGLAKNSKHRTNEILLGFPPKIIGMKPTDILFKFFGGMQEEVHRFAIKFHREKRSKSQVKSELDDIKGIGQKTKNDLILHFKSIKRLRTASLDELKEFIGTNRASIIYEYFRKNLSA